MMDEHIPQVRNDRHVDGILQFRADFGYCHL